MEHIITIIILIISSITLLMFVVLGLRINKKHAKYNFKNVRGSIRAHEGMLTAKSEVRYMHEQLAKKNTKF